MPSRQGPAASQRGPTARQQQHPLKPRPAKMQRGKGSRLQFLFDIAFATFSQPGLPTEAQISALRRTLSEWRPPPLTAARSRFCSHLWRVAASF